MTIVLALSLLLFIQGLKAETLQNSTPTPVSDSEFESILENGVGWERITALTDDQAVKLSHYAGIAINEDFITRFEKAAINDADDHQQATKQFQALLSILKPLRGSRMVLPLFSLRKLSARQAEDISRFHGHSLLLWSLETLDEPQAKALTKFRGDWNYSEIDMRGLASLSSRSALALTEFPGDNIVLDGLKRINDSLALALKRLDVETLSLNGLERLTLNQAQSLGAFSGERLSLDGLSSLTTLQARALAGFAGAALSLKGINMTDDVVMSELAAFRGQILDLSSLKYLSEGQAKVLAKYSGSELRLSGLTDMSDTQAEVFGEALVQGLYLDGIKWLSDSQIARLSRFSGKTLSLSSLNKIDISAFRLFSGNNLYLTGLTELSEKKVGALLNNRARMVWLNSAVNVSDKNFAALSQSDSVGLILPEVTSLRRIPLQLLMNWRGGLEFPNVTEFDELFLPALAAWDGNALHFAGVRELQRGQSQALSEFNCATLQLSGLRGLTDNDIQNLIKYRGAPINVDNWSKQARASYFQAQYAQRNKQ